MLTDDNHGCQIKAKMARVRQQLQKISPLSTEERERYESLKVTFHEQVAAGVVAFHRAGKALLTIRNERLYREQYATWADFCGEEFALTKSYANYMISAFEVIERLRQEGCFVLPDNERVCRELSRFPTDMQKMIWMKAQRIAKGRNPDSISIREAALQIVPGRRAKKMWKEAVLRKLNVARRQFWFSFDFTILSADDVHEIGKNLFEIQLLLMKHLGAVYTRLEEISEEGTKRREAAEQEAAEQAKRPKLNPPTTDEKENHNTDTP